MEENIDNTGTSKNEYSDVLSTEECLVEDVQLDMRLLAIADPGVMLTPEQIQEQLKILNPEEHNNEN